MNEATYHPLSSNLSSSLNLQEYFLQGSVPEASIVKLHERLQGLCDNVKPEPFSDLEKTYILNSPSSVPIFVKACKSLLKPSLPWQMKYIGSTELGDRTKNTMVRSNVTVAVSSDPHEFCVDLGFSPKFEIVLQGHFFRKGRLKITVTKIQKTSMFDSQKLEALANMPYLIEISALSSSGDKSASDEVKNFAQLLYPIVTMEKVDHRRLQQMT